jgi:hypothetical protein
MELFDFIWKGKCSWFISLRTNQYDESSVAKKFYGATFVPDSVSRFVPRKEILLGSSVG